MQVLSWAPKSTGVVVSNPGVVSRLAEDAHDGVSDVASSPVSLADGCVLSSANTLQHNCKHDSPQHASARHAHESFTESLPSLTFFFGETL